MTADDARRLTRERFNYIFDEIDTRIKDKATKGLYETIYFNDILKRNEVISAVKNHYTENGFTIYAFDNSITLNWS